MLSIINRLKILRKPIGVAVGGLLFLFILPPLFAQPTPVSPISVEEQSGPDDVERQRLVEEKIEVIRKEFVAGNFAQVLKLCEEAEQIVPRHPSVNLYREWARQKLQRTRVGEHADVDKSELPTDVWSVSPTVSPVPPQATSIATPREDSTAAVVARSAQIPNTPSAASSGNFFFLLLLSGIAAGVLLVGYVLFVIVGQKKRQATAPTFLKAASSELQIIEEQQPTHADSAKSAVLSAESKPALSSPFPMPGLGLSDASGGGAGLGLAGLSTLATAPSIQSADNKSVSEEVSHSERPSETQYGLAEEPPPLPMGESWLSSPEPPQVTSPSSAEKQSPPATPQSPFVSFEDLGIALPLEEPEPPSPPAQKTYSASVEESRIVISPVPPSLEAATPEPERLSLEGDTVAGPARDAEIPAIQLEDIIGGHPVEQPLVSPSAHFSSGEPQSGLDSRQAGGASQGQPPLPDEKMSLEALSLDLAEGEMDGLSLDTLSPSVPPPLPTFDDTSGVKSTPPKPTDVSSEVVADNDERTKTLSLHADDLALAETKAIELPTTFTQPPPPEPPVPSEPSVPVSSEDIQPSDQQKLDERSERMFREQLERGLRAFQEQNYKQAVHFLSIAAAIHPENQEVREKLRLARERKRQQESRGQ
ncbi:MAG: hypothetical protein N2Z21_00795 [Candidatus Sumerlaeaceae bacterium]|nr:hypothetical protein [Candidatus Sumerlaeaceae bacterium]